MLPLRLLLDDYIEQAQNVPFSYTCDQTMRQLDMWSRQDVELSQALTL